MPPAGRRRLLTLSTDLGAEYSAQVKAVLLRSVDPAQIVELTSGLPAHGIAESAFVLRAIAAGFPAGTVHLAVVDPGVGGRRRPIAIQCRDGSAVVGPDNGLLYPLAEALGIGRTVRLDPAQGGGRARVGTTFDARDLFAPAAARLARGAPLRSLGEEVAPTEYRIPTARRAPSGADGQVVHVDRFGNAISNVPSEWAPNDRRPVTVSFGRNRRVLPRATSYESIGRGRWGVLGSSFGTLEVAVAEGRASDRGRIAVGAPIRFRWPRRSPVVSKR